MNRKYVSRECIILKSCIKFYKRKKNNLVQHLATKTRTCLRNGISSYHQCFTCKRTLNLLFFIKHILLD